MKTLKELKKGNSKTSKMNALLFALIVTITLLYSVGYSLLNQNLSISGEAAYRVIADMRITDLSNPTLINGASITYDGTYGVNSTSLHVELPNKDSIVTYEVEITNMGNINQWIKSINATSNNENIVYTIDGLTTQEDIIYSPDVSNDNVKTFTITFSYKDSIKNGTESLPVGDETKLSTIISFEYEPLETYLITYDLDGGSVSSNPVNYTKASAIFTLNNPTKKGHTFLGWTGSNGDVPQTSITIEKLSEGDRNYIANWQINTYTLTINPNGGTYDGSTATVTSNIIYSNSITISIPTKTGYIFNGWTLSNEDSSLSGTTFTMGEGNTTLTANWLPITYTINYNCNGGKGSTPSSTHTYDVSKTLTSNGCYNIIAGTSGKIYKFLGWATSSTATSPEYSNGQSISNLTQTDGTTINLYAVWSATSIFTYNSSYNVLDDGSGNWRIKLLSNGTYTSNTSISVDVFLVGGGGGGGAYNLLFSGGGGGGSGYTATYKKISLSATTYSIIIGAGGSSENNGSATTAFNKSAAGGSAGNNSTGGAGGSGGGEGGDAEESGYYGGQYGNSTTYYGQISGVGQGTTTCEFGQGTTSGCNSGVTNYASGGSGGSGRAVFSSKWGASKPGISAGAGAGGSGGSGGNAASNTGSGGGGGAYKDVSGYSGGQGGSGIVVIRNAR